MKVETFVTMDYSEFDELAAKHLGIQTDFLADQEADNGGSYTFNIAPKDIAPFDWEWVEKFGFESSNPRHILMKMAEKGHIPFGKYLIEVSW